MDVGYIGLGNMGAALAERLCRLHDVSVYGRSAHVVARLEAAGARALSSARAVGAAHAVVFVCLRTSEEVRTAIFGPDGIALDMAPGGIIVDQTTGDAVATRAMADVLADRGIVFIDAPVSGGPQYAAAGTIAQLVGASETDLDRVRPLLEAISPNIVHCGPVGSGHVMKVANNLVAAGQRLLTFEAVALAVRNGVEPTTAVAAMQKSSARNYTLDVTFPRHILSGDLAQGFALGLMHKDVELALALSRESGVPLALGDCIEAQYRRIVDMLGAHSDVNTAIHFIERAAGIEICCHADDG